LVVYQSQSQVDEATWRSLDYGNALAARTEKEEILKYNNILGPHTEASRY